MNPSWYPLDGTWHPSVAVKLSVVHLSSDGGRTSACDPEGRKLALLKDDPHSEADVVTQGRTKCRKCAKAAR